MRPCAASNGTPSGAWQWMITGTGADVAAPSGRGRVAALDRRWQYPLTDRDRATEHHEKASAAGASLRPEERGESRHPAGSLDDHFQEE